MIYAISADFVVFIHFLWIIFLIFGALIAWRFKWLKILHIGGLGFAIIIQILGWYCPLTYLEVLLRSHYNPDKAYAGSFIGHYIEKIVYINVSSEVIFFLTICLIVVSLLIYLFKARNY